MGEANKLSDFLIPTLSEALRCSPSFLLPMVIVTHQFAQNLLHKRLLLVAGTGEINPLVEEGIPESCPYKNRVRSTLAWTSATSVKVEVFWVHTKLPHKRGNTPPVHTPPVPDFSHNA